MVRRTLTVMAAAAVTAAAALGAAGCGDDDGGGNGDGALSESEFAQRANRLCTEAASQRRTILSGIDPTASGSEQAEQLDGIIDIDEKLLADVDELVPPESEQDAVTQLLDQWRNRIDLEEQLREATAADDATELSELEAQVGEVDTRANQIASDLGLDECIRGAST